MIETVAAALLSLIGLVAVLFGFAAVALVNGGAPRSMVWVPFAIAIVCAALGLLFTYGGA